ncbi:MAG TPA: hypothetical protein VGI93_13990 [Steroidobacteraceae bacterium]|jgi:hypothetical protein
MSASIWWVSVVLTLLVVLKAWQNLLTTRRTQRKRRILVSALWFSLAICLPICALIIVRLANRWVWLLVAIATNGLLMMGCDCLLKRTDKLSFLRWAKHAGSTDGAIKPTSMNDQ